MTSRVLFVCLGNICRSPAAEGVFRTIMPAIATDSAGTAGWHVGKPPYAPMQAAAGARGYDLSKFRARQFTCADFAAFDLIFVMDEANRREVENLRPNGSETPVRLLTDYAVELGRDHVPDPYYTHDFDDALDLIEIAARGLAATL